MNENQHPHPNKGSEDEILTEAECAERLSVQRTTMWRLRRHEKLPYICLGDGPRPRVRYRWRAVEAWLDTRSKPLAAPVRKRGRPRNVDRSTERSGGPL